MLPINTVDNVFRPAPELVAGLRRSVVETPLWASENCERTHDIVCEFMTILAPGWLGLAFCRTSVLLSNNRAMNHAGAALQLGYSGSLGTRERSLRHVLYAA